MKISIGCGEKKQDGVLGLDAVDFGWNTVWCAGERIPVEDNSATFIEAHNFLEHVARETWPKLFNECHRVLKDNGVLEIVVPDASKDFTLAIQDPTHVSFVCAGTFTQYLAGGRPRNARYEFKKWRIVSIGPDPKDGRILVVRMSPQKV